MPSDPLHILPGPVRQNGYAVAGLERAIDAWLALGVGPWNVIGPMEQQGMQYRGQDTNPTITIAFANSGDLQLELITQLDDAPSIYKEFLDRGREGFHHLAWWAEDYAAVEAAARAEGWDLVTVGNTGGATHFFYAELAPVTSTVIEVMELNDLTRWLGETVRARAEGWDGSDPVRPLV